MNNCSHHPQYKNRVQFEVVKSNSVNVLIIQFV